MAAMAVTLTGLAVAGQDGSLATARTAADHARLADYYYGVARSYNQKESEEEQIAARWRKQYGNWSKIPNPYRSAMNLAGYYRQLAKDALAHAGEQLKLAGAGTRSGH